MLAVKDIVYKQHRVMLRLYEQYCKEAGQIPYWDNDEDDLDEGGAAACENDILDGYFKYTTGTTTTTGQRTTESERQRTPRG